MSDGFIICSDSKLDQLLAPVMFVNCNVDNVLTVYLTVAVFHVLLLHKRQKQVGATTVEWPCSWPILFAQL